MLLYDENEMFNLFFSYRFVCSFICENFLFAMRVYGNDAFETYRVYLKQLESGEFEEMNRELKKVGYANKEHLRKPIKVLISDLEQLK